MSDHGFWNAAASLLAGHATRCEISADRQEFVHWATTEGLAGLLLQAASGREGWDPLRAELRQAVFHQAAIVTLQEQELRRVLESFAREGISPLLLKGAALAYTVYSDPVLRPRSDTDLFVREADEPRARLALEALGYDREFETEGRLVTSQFHYTRSDLPGVRHVCDVHLKIANAQAYASRLTYEELRNDAVSLPRLHHDALGPSAVHSLLVACVHRIAHHCDGDSLLWLHDIHLLARHLSAAEWERARALAEEKQLSGVVRRGLERSAGAFGPVVPDTIWRRLEVAARDEPRSPLFDATTRTFDVVLSDFAALPGPRERLQLLREHLFPPLAYMRQLYTGCPRALLLLTYPYRIARGAPKWFRRP